MFTGVFAKGEFKQNPLRRHLSVEMEVNVYNGENSKVVNEVLDKWEDGVVSDGSIGREGFEINTNPTNGDLFVKHITEICDGLALIGGGCTTACGLHVHVNVKGTPLYRADGSPLLDADKNQQFDPRTAYTHYDLRRLILLYHKVEPALFSLCTPQRLDGRYSQICGKYYLTKQSDPKGFRKDLVTKMYRGGESLPAPVTTGLRPARERGSDFMRLAGNDLKAKKKTKYQEVRYKALNLHSFFLRGTIEFRHKEGTVNASEVINWALVCGNLVDQASRMTEKQIELLPKSSSQALIEIMPGNLQDWIKEKLALQEKLIPRFKAMIADKWQQHCTAEESVIEF
jgi:hypothetical protein